ncbi:Oidioi.mRNA.OKI2018_I69.chr1.g3750.t1.cds [Oikopleura dioica]|uniref:Oidioi.mRNA.OKI2018_I69.chr1.g3750.t1.cds n=1 Tax=Oikopleura dioica TaxID=34765 RepID=A0ABN7SZE7_OIKDI|nr:Oidioi.mRNA.OKI2018_I69.chr1.g3750.t1.cds [Oikopleura dioica]
MKLFSSFALFSLQIEARKPNVILLNTDDFGIGDFTIYNREAKVPTPNIDRIGNEGVKFLGASSASSRCSPSRYMLMTGRYSMEDIEARIINQGEPHLGEMFKKAGYKTGIFGKQQPIPNGILPENATNEDKEAIWGRNKEALKYKMEVGKFPNTLTVNQKFGYYVQTEPPQLLDYDYSFTQRGLCCAPGLHFENGRSTEPAETWVKLQPYPETAQEENYNPNGHNFPYTGYFGPEGHMENMTDPYEITNYCGWARQTIAGKTFDSREVEQENTSKLEKFIEDNHESPFFAYYGMNNGHAPFNTPLRFRNETEVGLFGEVILEADELVGRILDKLEEHDIADDTLVIFMCDNGPTTIGHKIKSEWGHNQWLLDLPESRVGPARTVELKGYKNGMGEASHRAPFLWRYPRKFAPRIIYEPKVQVSTVDIYATLAELIDYDLGCNEAPDSRSFLSYLETGEASEEIKKKPIMTHAFSQGNESEKKNAAIRKGNMKYNPGSKELFNTEWDPEETHNYYGEESFAKFQSYLDQYLIDWLNHIDAREEATKRGADKENCYPQFERFNWL